VTLNYLFWGPYFKTVFAAETDALVEALEGRLLLTFSGVEQEAEQKAEEEWEKLCSLPAENEDGDLSDAAEQASEAGLRYYQLMMGLQQGLVNLFAVALYHLYEQQLMFFHRKEVLHPAEENDPALFSLKAFGERLMEHGIDITQFACWPTIQELRLLANTVKHGDGRSAEELLKTCQDLFVPPDFDEIPVGLPWSFTGVFKPLMGEDVYVSMDHLKRYAESVKQFWSELYDGMAQA